MAILARLCCCLTLARAKSSSAISIACCSTEEFFFVNTESGFSSSMLPLFAQDKSIIYVRSVETLEVCGLVQIEKLTGLEIDELPRSGGVFKIEDPRIAGEGKLVGVLGRAGPDPGIGAQVIEKHTIGRALGE